MHYIHSFILFLRLTYPVPDIYRGIEKHKHEAVRESNITILNPIPTGVGGGVCHFEVFMQFFFVQKLKSICLSLLKFVF